MIQYYRNMFYKIIKLNLTKLTTYSAVCDPTYKQQIQIYAVDNGYRWQISYWYIYVCLKTDMDICIGVVGPPLTFSIWCIEDNSQFTKVCKGPENTWVSWPNHYQTGDISAQA